MDFGGGFLENCWLLGSLSLTCCLLKIRDHPGDLPAVVLPAVVVLPAGVAVPAVVDVAQLGVAADCPRWGRNLYSLVFAS